MTIPVAANDPSSLALEWVDGRVVVFAGGRVLADSTKAAVVRSLKVDTVWMVPFADVQEQWLEPAERPSRAEPSRTYFDLVVSGDRIHSIAWTCEGPGVAAELASYMALDASLTSRVAVLPKPATVRARA